MLRLVIHVCVCLAHVDQEIPENAADVPHLEYLHGPFITSGTDLRATRLPCSKVCVTS
jgi:hypothetical protein